MPTSFFEVVYLRSSVLAGRCLPAVLTFTCGAIASTAGVDLSLPPVAPADVPALFHPRVGDIYLRWGRDVYLRCFWCLPPVGSPTLGGSKFVYTSGGSCGRAYNTRPRIGTFTCGAETRLPSGGCIPPVAVAQSLARRLPFGKLPAVLSPPRRVWV